MDKLLKNPFYTGQFRYDGGVHQGSHPAMISVERFEKRLERMAANRNGSLTGQKRHLFSKFLSCPHSGRTFIAEKQHGAHKSGTYIYYRHLCPGRTSELRFKESDLQSQKMRLYDLYALKSVRLEEVSEKLREYERRIEVRERHLKALNQDSRKVFRKIFETVELLKELPLAYLRAGSSEEKLKVLSSMAHGLTLSKEGELRIRWKRPYSLIVRPEVEEAIVMGSVERLERIAVDASTRRSEHEKTRSSYRESDHQIQVFLSGTILKH